MRILFLTPYLPSPPRFGGARRMHGLITTLARSHSISLLSFVDPGEDHSESLRATGEYCDEIVTVENDRYGLSATEKRKLQLKSMLSIGSYERYVYYRPAMQTALDRMLRHQRYDVINVEFSQMAHYRFSDRVRIVLDEHNVEYDILHRTCAAETGLVRKLYNYVDYLKLRREEQAAWCRFDACSLTSARDEQMLHCDYPGVQTMVVPNGVDTDFFCPSGVESEPMSLLFFGAVDYYPNTHGLLFFLHEVMPKLKLRYPLLKLFIVGQSPPKEISCWASDDVVVTGVVDDVRPYIERARAAIVPLHIGGGTRLKVLEAMAMGKVVVSTHIGTEGIDVTDEQDVLLGDTAEEFSAQLVRVLEDDVLTRRLGVAARSLIERRYDWRISVRKLEGLYQELIA